MKKRFLSLILALIIVLGAVPKATFASVLNTTESSESITDAAYNIESRNVSQGVQNIVKRAKQMTDIEWTPKSDITGWGYEFTYKAGVTYKGLPYGQPTNANGCRGDYVPWEISLDKYLEAVNNENSLMYTSSANYNKIAPYYSVDCSGFVSWAWDLPVRTTASGLRSYATLISTSSYEEAQIGDCLCNASAHAALITDVTRDANGKVTSIEVSESNVGSDNNYCCYSVRYGEGGEYTLSKFKTKFIDRGYYIYRSNTRDSAEYTHSCAVPLEGDDCDKCGYNSAPKAEDFIKDAYPCYAEITTKVPASVRSMPCTGETSEYSEEIYKTSENETLTVTGLYLSTDGNLWYKVTVNDTVGYILAAETNFLQLLDSDVSVTNLVEPDEITEGKAFSLGGLISAKYVTLSKIVAMVTEDDSTILHSSADVNTHSYSLKNSTVDYGLKFNDLPVGYYNYELYVTIKNCYTADGIEIITDISKEIIHKNLFRVISSIIHSCDYSEFLYYSDDHPHYGYYKCSVCGLVNQNAEDTGYVSSCEICNPVNPAVKSVPMYRMYDPNGGEHFYTGSVEERDFLINAGWQYEGVGFNFPVVGKPVYRLYEPATGEHLYTMDEEEKAKLLNEGWNYEGVAFNSAGENEVPQYRLHNPNATRGAYHFTGSLEERDILIAAGWEYQGIGFYSCIR